MLCSIYLLIHVFLSYHSSISPVYCFMYLFMVIVFFFKQKTAYEMRISDWSSDVCSSDLPVHLGHDQIENDEIERARTDQIEPFGTIECGGHGKAFELKRKFEHFAQQIVIIDNQYLALFHPIRRRSTVKPNPSASRPQ